MNIELSKKQFRRLLDLVYIGNWILNSTRGDQRFKDYDDVESLLFARAALEGMPALAELYQGEIIPSKAFVEGGIHEAIAEYENNVFFDILAEDLARRDMNDAPIDESNLAELTSRMEVYISEFEKNGTDNVTVEMEN
jgi:5'(3')-deoxyribonucleotidase